MKDEINKMLGEHLDSDPEMWEHQKFIDKLLDLIAKELPDFLEGENWESDNYDAGWNACLADIKHKLGVE